MADDWNHCFHTADIKRLLSVYISLKLCLIGAQYKSSKICSLIYILLCSYSSEAKSKAQNSKVKIKNLCWRHFVAKMSDGRLP